MLFREKIKVENDDWLTRSVFTAAEERLDSMLVPLLALGDALEDEKSLDRIIQVIRAKQPLLLNQVTLVDMSNPNPSLGRFLLKGAYRSCALDVIETLGEIQEPLMRKNAVYDAFAMRGLGFPICSKNRGVIGGVSYSYDRVMVPIQSPHFNLMISAYWSESL